MNNKRIVIALGGNALGDNLHEQMMAVKTTARAIVGLIKDGNQVVISHGNGPQVGLINNAMTQLSRSDKDHPMIPLSVCVAMSQAYIGYDLQNALREALRHEKLDIPVTTMITQVRVDPKDPAFENPSKPIGHFMNKEQADAITAEYGYLMKEDAGRGYRRVVASPKPVEIIEIQAIRTLMAAGQVVIAAGGGGIPVVLKGHHLKGAHAVIDKDFASCLLAKELDAHYLIILTAVEKVAIHFNTPQVRWLSHMDLDEARRYIEDGQFAEGSMLPKIQAAVDFAASKKGRIALITLLEKAKDGIDGKTGTIISDS